MKKKIDFIPMDSGFCVWLLEKLRKEAPRSACAQELSGGLLGLLSGEVNSLLLSASAETGDLPIVPTDEIKIGELEIYPKSRRKPGRSIYEGADLSGGVVRELSAR